MKKTFGVIGVLWTIYVFVYFAPGFASCNLSNPEGWGALAGSLLGALFIASPGIWVVKRAFFKHNDNPARIPLLKLIKIFSSEIENPEFNQFVSFGYKLDTSSIKDKHYKYFYIKNEKFTLLYNRDEIIYNVNQEIYDEFLIFAKNNFQYIKSDDSFSDLYYYKNIAVTFVTTDNYSIIIKKSKSIPSIKT